MRATAIDLSSVRDLRPDALDSTGRLRVLPASFYAQTSIADRAVFGVRTANYLLPTDELVQWLKLAIGGRSSLEIGSGNGVLAQAVGIRATDNHLQARPEIASHYRMLKQPTVDYGRNVEPLDAHAAVVKYKPEVVVAAWVTHKFDESRAQHEGNQFGVVEERIIENCETYIFIGNTEVHKGKSIWSLEHRRIEPPWLFSRAHNGSADFIAVWGKVPDSFDKLDV